MVAPDPLRYKRKYRIPSARKRTWDYGSNAAYFVTICTKNRIPYFGTIDDDIVHDDTALVVEAQHVAPLQPTENECPYVMSDHTRMHTTSIGDAARRCWMAIPNHFPFVKLDAFVVMPNHIHGIVIIDKPAQMPPQTNRFGPQSQNLASIIRGFKIGVTKFARENEMDFGWQTRFHDRIVREDGGLGMIRFYIQANPLRWVIGRKDGYDFSHLSPH